jgi:hypothetical protein
MQEHPAANKPEETDEVDDIIALCSGDARAAVQALLVANSFLEAEVERLSASISRGYVRGQLDSNSAMARLWRGC